MPRKQSDIFKHYAEIKENGKVVKYICKYCSQSYAIRNATKQQKHIEKCKKAPSSVKSTDHGQNILIDITSPIPSTSSAVVPPTTPLNSRSEIHLGETSAPKKQKLSPYFDTMSESEQINADKHLARAIYASGSPLQLTANKHWKRFFQVIRPAYIAPSRYMLSNNLLDSEYNRVQEKAKETTDNSDCLCIISDGWSNIRNESIINFLLTTPRPIFLKCVDTQTNKHTGVYIGDLIKNVIKESGSTKVFAIITDNAKNMKAAWEEVRKTYPHILTICCSAHGLNLLLGDICELRTLDNLVKKAKKLIKAIKHKHILNAMFITKQKERKLSYALKLPSKTRWGGVIIMFQSLANGKASLRSMAITEELENDLDADIRSMILDNDVFWQSITMAIKLLNPIVDGIAIVEGDKTTLSRAIKVLHDIEKKMDENLLESPLNKAEEIKVKNFVKARRKFMIQPAHYAACIVDPNFVDEELELLKPADIGHGYDVINSIAEHLKLDTGIVMASLATFRTNDGLWRSASIWNSAKHIQAATWWKGICSGEALAPVASILVQIPPSSASSERNWSVFGSTHTKNRNRLTNQRVEKIVAIKSNLELFEEDPLGSKTTTLALAEAEYTDTDGDNSDTDGSNADYSSGSDSLEEDLVK